MNPGWIGNTWVGPNTFFYYSNQPVWWGNYWTPYYTYSNNFWRPNFWSWNTPVVNRPVETKPKPISQPRRWNTNTYRPRTNTNRPESRTTRPYTNQREYPNQVAPIKKYQPIQRTPTKTTPTKIMTSPTKTRTGGVRTGKKTGNNLEN